MDPGILQQSLLDKLSQFVRQNRTKVADKRACAVQRLTVGSSSEFGEDGVVDGDLGEAGLHPVVDADSSQTLAVLDAMNGRNLVIQGPPGTGKSQSITNLIGEALARGKTVLFVAEKMAALEVVKRRLDTVHLGDACLELHSHKTRVS